MRLSTTFHSNECKMGTTFGKVYEVSGGGYEKGYTEGHRDGVNEGFENGRNEGLADGYRSGYSQGNEAGKAEAYAEIGALNDELEQTLYREDAEKSLETNIRQADADFKAIKDTANSYSDELEGSGFLIPRIEDETKTSEYADKLRGLIAVVDRESYERGVYDGYFDGLDRGLIDGEEIGRKAEYTAFWESAFPGYFDAEKQTLTLVSSTAAFAGPAWNDFSFRNAPQITLKGNCNYCFYVSKVTDITDRVTFKDVSMCNSGFSYSKLKKIPALPAPSGTSYTSVFAFSSSLESIVELGVHENLKYYAAFDGCTALNHMIVKGVIGQNGFDVKWSPLDKESLTSIAKALSTTTSGLTVTLSLDAVNAAFETSAGANDGSTSAEWLALVGQRKNWNIVLATV